MRLHYITNFQPQISPSVIQKVGLKKIFRNHKSDKIFCKNFIIFMLLAKHCFKDCTPTAFIKPFYKNTFNVLKAPYKNKIARHQMTLSRYHIIVKFKFNLDFDLKFDDLDSFLYFLQSIKSYYSFFETNICYQHKSFIEIPFLINDFFFLKKYS